MKIFSRSFWIPFLVASLQGLWFIYYFLIEKDSTGQWVRLLLTDDAMISMDYARSLVQGCGLVWYCGAEKVEGFTNPLWVLYMAFWHLWPLPPSLASLPIVLTGFGTLYIQFRYAGKLAETYFSKKVACLTQWGLAVLPPAVLWHFMGLETGALMALFMYLSYRASEKNKPSFSDLLLLSLGLLLRMDFLITAGALAVFWSWRTRTYSPFLLVSLVSGATLAALTVGRWYYYGSWVPNTYVLKVSSIPLLLRLANGALTLVGSILTNLPLWGLAIYGAYRTGWFVRPTVFTLLIAGGMSAYTVYVGGDAWEMAPLSNRYLALVYPLLIVLVAAGINLWAPFWRIAALLAISAGVSNRWALLSALSPYVRPLTAQTVSNVFSVFVPFPLPDLGIPSGAKVWLGPAGTTPYFYPEYRYGDYLGKCDSAVARHSPVCYATMRFYQLYAPGHTRIGIDRVLGDKEAHAVFISARGHPGRVRLTCEGEKFLPALSARFQYRAPYGWIKKE